MGAKPLCIRFDKVDGFIKIYDGTRYLLSFGPKNMIQFMIELDILQVKKVVLHIVLIIILQESELIQVIPIEKTLTFHNVIVLIKSVFNKIENNYYYNIFLEKG